MMPVQGIFIIGAGDNVSKRLLPAILRARLTNNITIIHNGHDLVQDIQTSASIEKVFISEKSTSLKCNVNFLLEKNSWPIFFCVPPSAQLDILVNLKNRNRHIILEKPLFASTLEAKIYEMIPQREALFCSSYYTLEKALTWTNFFEPHEFYKPFLVYDSRFPYSSCEALSAIGAIKSITIKLREGPENPESMLRPFWFEKYMNGIWFDMGVHAFSLLRKIAPFAALSDITVSSSEFKVYITGTLAGVKTIIEFGKFYQKEKCARYLSAEFVNGRIFCNFDTRQLNVYERSSKIYSVSINPFYSMRYDVLVGLSKIYMNSKTVDWVHPEINHQKDALQAMLDIIR